MKGLNILEFESLLSTSSKAKELMARGCEPWTVVSAKYQTGGHGKANSQWFSPLGGLYFSIVLPSANIKDLHILTIITAYVVADVIKEDFNLEPMIKLPNDVLVNGRKFCGILTENIISGENINPVIGIGINTNIDYFPENLSNIATSTLSETGMIMDNRILLEKIVNNLRTYFDEIIN